MLSVGNRFSCVIENLINIRYQDLFYKLDNFKFSRFGCHEGMNIDLLINKLHTTLAENNNVKKKQCLVSFDQSHAYNSVCLPILIIKLKRAIQSTGEIDKYLVILAFTTKWAFRRRTIFKGMWLVFECGLGQGLPLSVTNYILYFDFSITNSTVFASDVELLFMDDNSYVLAANSWKLLDEKATKLQVLFSTWCKSNNQLINKKKSTILYFNRTLPSVKKLGFLNIKPVVRCLGIYIDSSVNYCHHANLVKTWINRRVGVLKLLRCRLDIDIHVLVRILISYRMKAYHGCWWYFYASESQRQGINSAFMNAFRAATGFSKLVDFETMQNFFGIDNTASYADYILAMRGIDGLEKLNGCDLLTLIEKT